MELFEGGIARGDHAGAGEHGRRRAGARAARRARLLGRGARCPSGRALRAAGPFVKASRTPVAWTRPAPDVGEHTAEVLDALPAPADPRVPTTAGPASGARARLPLEGVKFADFSWIGVGPDHRQGTRRPRRHRRARRDRQARRPAAPRRPVQGRHRRDQPLPVLRLVQHVEALAAARTCKHPDGHGRSPSGCSRGATSPSTPSPPARWRRSASATTWRRALNPDIIMATHLPDGSGPARRAKLAGYGYHAAAVSGFYEITGWDDRAARRALQRLHRHDRAALPGGDA